MVLYVEHVKEPGLVNTMFRVTTGCGFESLAGQLKSIHCLLDEMLNRGPV